MSSTDTPVIHPGQHLKRLLEERGLNQTDLAFILGIKSTSVNQIVVGKRGITPSMSKALGVALSLPPEYFAHLQTAYDMAFADAPDSKVSVRAGIVSAYPVREMIKRGWLSDANAADLHEQLARFFECDNIDSVPYLAHAAKKTVYEENNVEPAQLAWLYRVRHIAKAMPAPSYSKPSLERALESLKALTGEPEEARHVPRLLSECGVRFVVVEALPHARIDGACLWLNGSSPVIGMSTRFDRIDNFWFVLRHEIEHVLQGHGRTVEMLDVDLEGDRAGVSDGLPEEERTANAAAADFCVPGEKLESFIRRKHPFYYEKDVLAFAKLHGLHPGMVVGQLQRRMGRYDYLRRYLVKIRHHVLPGAIVDGWGQSMPL